jgi:hypothetical protein
MASIIKEVKLTAGYEKAWAMLRNVAAADKAFPGILIACRMEDAVRTVTFANGSVVRERIVTIDEARRRVVYGVIEGRFSHHSASMQVLPEGGGSRLVWVSDFLPDEGEPMVRALVDEGAEAFRRAVEAAP